MTIRHVYFFLSKNMRTLCCYLLLRLCFQCSILIKSGISYILSIKLLTRSDQFNFSNEYRVGPEWNSIWKHFYFDSCQIMIVHCLWFVCFIINFILSVLCFIILYIYLGMFGMVDKKEESNNDFRLEYFWITILEKSIYDCIPWNLTMEHVASWS